MSCHVRESKTVLYSGFGAMISRFQLLDSGSFFIRYWIPYSRLLELHSGFQIPPAKISLPQAPEFPDFGSCEFKGAKKLSTGCINMIALFRCTLYVEHCIQSAVLSRFEMKNFHQFSTVKPR